MRSSAEKLVKASLWCALSLAAISLAASLPAAALGSERSALKQQAQTKLPPPKDVSGPPPNAARTASGLASLTLRQGSGSVHPGPRDQVRVHYTGWTTDGEMFDSSVVRGQPATFPLDRVIPGFSEGLQLMVVGERRLLWIPEHLAYHGRPGRPQGMLVFEVELLEILPPTP